MEEKLLSENNSTILEEILELTRMNQKLIRNPEGIFVETVTKINESINNLQHKIMRTLDLNNRRHHYRDVRSMMFEDFFHSPEFKMHNYIGMQMILSFFRDDFPWIYDSGKELIEILKSRKSKQDKYDAVEEFKKILDLSFEHPLFKKMQMNNKDIMIMYRELPRFFMRYLDMTDKD